MRTLILTVVASSFLFLGCAGKSMKQKLDPWLGRDISEAIASWGPPTSTYEMPNDRKMYTWRYDGGAYALPVGGMVMAGRRHCEVSLITQEGRIVRWRYDGNACN